MNNKILLWESDVPGLQKGVDIPYMTYYPATQKKSGGCVLIFPGGGYHVRCSSYEGEDYAKYLSGLGIDAFVVEYRVSPNYFPLPLLDARRAVRVARSLAKKLGYAEDKIGVMGSSAGGHLAALVSTYRGGIAGEGVDALDKIDCLPNAQILCYPVIDTADDAVGHVGSKFGLLGPEQVENGFGPSVAPHLIADEMTPPAFVWHTSRDELVNVNNSYRYAVKMRELDIPFELHVFPYGRHGLGLADCDDRLNPHVAQWSGLLASWLKLVGFTK